MKRAGAARGTGSTPGPGQAAASGQSAAAGHAIAAGPGRVPAARRAAAGGQDAEPAAPGGPDRSAARWWRSLTGRRLGGHLLLLVGYVGAGIAVTWPMTAHLADGRLLDIPDVSSYVWALWWMAHQVTHLGNPWFTHSMAAPVGIELGFDTLMPLPGLIMTPVTVLAGPAVSFDVLTIVTPGLLCYVMYRAARLWLGQPGAIAAGAFFGLSSMLAWQDLYHLNISVGTLFLPLTLEAAIGLRRQPGRRAGVILGLVLAGSVLTNQESAVVACLLAAVILVPWLVQLVVAGRGLGAARAQLRVLALGAVVAVVVASPQLFAMIRQVIDGGTEVGASDLSPAYRQYGVGLSTLFAPSPRLGHFHLGHVPLAHLDIAQLASAYNFAEPTEGIPTFGIALSVLALIGLALTWRRHSSWWLALLWLAGAALALGPTLTLGSRAYIPLATSWDGVTVSQLMPYTWLIRIPGLSALREADRLALLGLMGAAVLAGAAIQWLVAHLRLAAAVAVITVIAAGALLEAGWSATAKPTMATTMPLVDQPIAADHSDSIVVDLPFGLRGGVAQTGSPMPPQALVMATADGHPRAISYTSWVPRPTQDGIKDIPFYQCLYNAQVGHPCHGQVLVAARRSAHQEHIGWIVIWHSRTSASRPSVTDFLRGAGFAQRYRYNTGIVGVTLWRPRAPRP